MVNFDDNDGGSEPGSALSGNASALFWIEKLEDISVFDNLEALEALKQVDPDTLKRFVLPIANTIRDLVFDESTIRCLNLLSCLERHAVEAIPVLREVLTYLNNRKRLAAADAMNSISPGWQDEVNEKDDPLIRLFSTRESLRISGLRAVIDHVEHGDFLPHRYFKPIIYTWLSDSSVNVRRIAVLALLSNPTASAGYVACEAATFPELFEKRKDELLFSDEMSEAVTLYMLRSGRFRVEVWGSILKFARPHLEAIVERREPELAEVAIGVLSKFAH